MRQAEEEAAILQKACAACQADGNLSLAAMAAEIAREVGFLTRELEELEHRLATGDYRMGQPPEGATQAWIDDFAQKAADEIMRRADRLREARACTLAGLTPV